MGTKWVRAILYCFIVSSTYAQTIDVNFGRKGLLLFKELRMESSNIVDFDVVEEGKLNVFFESEVKRYLVGLNQKGRKETVFEIDSSYVSNHQVTPVAISSKPDGSVLVLSNSWNEENWVVAVNQFNWDGTVDKYFGEEGVYEKNILENQDNNYAQHMYVSSKGEIIVVAKVCQFHMHKETEKVAILKISEVGETLSSQLYDENYFSLNCAAMNDDRLLLAYSESLDDGAEQATYLVGFDSDQMIPRNVDCLNIDSEYQSFAQLVVVNSEIYASNIQSDSENIYNIRKYDIDGNLDESFSNSGEMDFSADIYNSDFVVNDRGEVFIVSISLDNTQEILVKKLSDDGTVDETFGADGVAAISLKYPIEGVNKIRLDGQEGMYISGTMSIMGGSFGFITKLRLNLQQLKREQLDDFLEELFTKE